MYLFAACGERRAISPGRLRVSACCFCTSSDMLFDLVQDIYYNLCIGNPFHSAARQEKGDCLWQKKDKA